MENMRANSWTDERDEASLDVVPEELAKGSVLPMFKKEHSRFL
jgi:hypothetical protein